MSELDSALDRLGIAVSKLIAASGQNLSTKEISSAVTSQISDLTTERDMLRAEVDELRALHDEDAKLRVEAAAAVKIALADLRSLVATKKKAG